LTIILAGSIYIYINRRTIFDYSINRLTKDLLPAAMEVGEVNFDLKEQRLTLRDLKIQNPSKYDHRYMIEIPLAKCTYTQKDDQDIFKGIQVQDIDLLEPSIFLERHRDGSVNLREIGEVFRKNPVRLQKSSFKTMFLAALSYLLSPIKNIDDLIEFKPVFRIGSGNLVFDDMNVGDDRYRTTIDNIDARVSLTLSKDFKSMEDIETEGRGIINKDSRQTLEWITAYHFDKSYLTMSNTIKLHDVDILHFSPYYDEYSPFVIKRGTVSGELIINFDNTSIGSMNELRISALDIERKEDFPHSGLWTANIDSLYQYFKSQTGVLVFDFKIKGDIDNPRFYLGSKTKRIVAGMAIDKLTSSEDVEKAVDFLKDILE